MGTLLSPGTLESIATYIRSLNRDLERRGIVRTDRQISLNDPEDIVRSVPGGSR